MFLSVFTKQIETTTKTKKKERKKERKKEGKSAHLLAEVLKVHFHVTENWMRIETFSR